MPASAAPASRQRRLGGLRRLAGLRRFAGVLRLGLKLALVTVLAAELTALMAAPWSTAAGPLVATLLLLAPAAAIGLVAEAAQPAWAYLLHCSMRAAARARLKPSTLLVRGSAAALVLAGGFYLVARFVVDAPIGPWALIGDGLTLGLALLVAWVPGAGAQRRVGARHAAARGRLSWRALHGLGWLAAGVACGLIDGLALPREHVEIHDLLLAATLVTFACGAWWLASAAVRLRRALWATSALALAGFAVAATHGRGDPYRAIAATYSAHARVLTIARALGDRDGDGFSAWLGGGDCDDDDPRAYPLSTVGRDCLGWVGPVEAAPLPEVTPPSPTPPPKVVLLLTVDTLRCGLGSADAAAGADAPLALCPALDRLAAAGRARFDAHTLFPVTARALTTLHTGDVFATPAPTAPAASLLSASTAAHGAFHLASFFAAHGYRTRAIVTHPYAIADAGVRASFAVLDRSLMERATAPSETTADEISDRVLAAVEAAGGEPLFLWAHYFDPHAPYVVRRGDRLVRSEPSAYAAEVRRTDAAIGRLTAALARRPDAARVLVFITADHGEQFGEHGGRNHGNSLHEEVMRVPMLAWSAGADHRAFAARTLPHTLAGVAGWLAALVTGRPFVDDTRAFMRTSSPDDPALALVGRDGWKLIYHVTLNFAELYDLGSDPWEQHDRAAAEPERVTALGRQLGGYWHALAARGGDAPASLAALTP